jgi:hypothetical protein
VLATGAISEFSYPDIHPVNLGVLQRELPDVFDLNRELLNML